MPQVAYGATICSFLGGVHWGAAFGDSAGAVRCHLVLANQAIYISLLTWAL